MTSYVALLRAVNVGGTGKLPMSELKAMCEAAGFEGVRTYIASGNVVLRSRLGEAAVKRALEQPLAAYAGKAVGVMVRTAAEMSQVLADNPFPDAPGNRVVTIFLDSAVPVRALDEVSGRQEERLALGRREIYVHYGDGMADSRLRIAAASAGTGRNMNTVRSWSAWSWTHETGSVALAAGPIFRGGRPAAFHFHVRLRVSDAAVGRLASHAGLDERSLRDRWRPGRARFPCAALCRLRPDRAVPGGAACQRADAA